MIRPVKIIQSSSIITKPHKMPDRISARSKAPIVAAILTALYSKNPSGAWECPVCSASFPEVNRWRTTLKNHLFKRGHESLRDTYMSSIGGRQDLSASPQNCVPNTDHGDVGTQEHQKPIVLDHEGNKSASVQALQTDALASKGVMPQTLNPPPKAVEQNQESQVKDVSGHTKRRAYLVPEQVFNLKWKPRLGNESVTTPQCDTWVQSDVHTGLVAPSEQLVKAVEPTEPVDEDSDMETIDAEPVYDSITTRNDIDVIGSLPARVQSPAKRLIRHLRVSIDDNGSIEAPRTPINGLHADDLIRCLCIPFVKIVEGTFTRAVLKYLRAQLADYAPLPNTQAERLIHGWCLKPAKWKRYYKQAHNVGDNDPALPGVLKSFKQLKDVDLSIVEKTLKLDTRKYSVHKSALNLLLNICLSVAVVFPKTGSLTSEFRQVEPHIIRILDEERFDRRRKLLAKEPKLVLLLAKTYSKIHTCPYC